MDIEKEYRPNVDVDPKKCKKSKNNVSLPKNAFALYIKLYCSRKDTKSLKHTSKMIEATKSWITLSDFEKQKFYKKYKEYQQKYSDVFVNHLQKSKPFMKRKVSSRTKKCYVSNNGHLKLEEEENEQNVPNLESEQLEGNNGVNEICDNFDETERENIEETCYEEDTLKQSTISYPEPIAPNLISGKELFEVVQSNTENNLTWSTLPPRERSLYNQAILTMKKDYIHKYKLYLENLTEKELFDHYNKCFQ
ncbi:uncharacterized protein LOC115448349 [Manduca sexta]|uniref:uncharacterized protein LOC115448349 n=1 Tax=Manduca sexta TaxID=7130 RepID=UPI001183C4CA|nr:uncharacterized protein LOC115448349 [Manduca sexta]